ncbi:hypothetical protein H696_01293 [Fonticula alba]|uniref:Sugar phosphate transporter domain-containing protein n=1 Tax=Fonticula alba TaxID=691883 RepID=A0A058ZBW1_FONAL|nr:hypothetical protein H696_01293 [Fonticula alba]KCV71884.1 hypothetical protein H696_01293 [Fonticula alba]|eukprot:XP_009493462.1 hypothetical protein H696_01293 [Fonticula alba]
MTVESLKQPDPQVDSRHPAVAGTVADSFALSNSPQPARANFSPYSPHTTAGLPPGSASSQQHIDALKGQLAQQQIAPQGALPSYQIATHQQTTIPMENIQMQHITGGPSDGGPGGKSGLQKDTSSLSQTFLDDEFVRLKHTKARGGPGAAVGHGTPTSSPSVGRIFSVILFYWIISLSTVFLNKYIFSSGEMQFSYPLLVTWYQILFALAALTVCGELGKRVRLFSAVPPVRLNRVKLQAIMPLTVLYVLMLALNNLCLKYVEVTFYQVARSLTIPFSIVFGFLLHGQRTSKAALLTSMVVVAGFVLGAYGEVHFSWSGILFGVGASACVSLYGLFVKQKLAVVDDNEWLLQEYNTALASVLMIPLIILSGEWNSLMNSPSDLAMLYMPRFWAIMSITALAGWMINLAMFLQIKTTTPLTNSISGTAKSCVQSLLAWMIYKNPVSGMNFAGIVLSLVGSSAYSMVRYREMKRAAALASRRRPE